MDAKILHELFEYRDGELYWKVAKARNLKIGDKAGCKRKDGRAVVKINNKLMMVYRIIFAMHHGYFPKYIDHIDSNPQNDKIENLREATLSENAYNRVRGTNNASGIKNVSWNTRRKKWRVVIEVDKQSIEIGHYEDIEFASLVAEEARNKYHGSYANHG